MTKFLGGLPAGDANGLYVIGQALVNRPTENHVIVAVITTKKITTDVDSGDREATVRLVRAEVVHPNSAEGDLEAAERLMRRAMERRHGGEMLPIEMEDELTDLFERVSAEWLQEQQPEPTDVTGLQEAGDEDGDEPDEPPAAD